MTSRSGYPALVAQLLEVEPEELPFWLRPIAALDEVIAVSGAVQSGHAPPQPHDRRSLKNDAQESLSRIGPSLKREISPALQEFQKELKNLHDLLESGSGAARLKGAARILREQLRTKECSAAAWNDLISAAKRGKEEEVLLNHSLQLKEIEGAIGHDWQWRKRQIITTLDEEGLEKCQRIFLSPQDDGAEFAWLVFTEADIESGFLRIGQVQFFSHRLWPEISSRTLNVATEGFEFPDEISSQFEDLVNSIRADVKFVLARVELSGKRATGKRNFRAHGKSPERWARDLVLGMVEAATFSKGGTSWQMMNGHAIWHRAITGREAGGWSFKFFTDASEDQRLRAMSRDADLAIQDSDTRFFDSLAEGNPMAREALTEIRWHNAAKRQAEAAQALALHVRSFERILPITGNEHWNETLSRYFREHWVLAGWKRDFFSLAGDLYLVF
ncbi:hypothetical protein, partial [Actinocorallia aurantiaca]|uniref:hypothetical protein n=1 Tax=Actinocorallia aurantiaca TaxID=46204 RepID=UPI0031DF92F4